MGFLFSFLNSFFSSLLKSQQSDFKPLPVAWVCVCFLQNGSCRHTRWEKQFPTASLRAALKTRESGTLRETSPNAHRGCSGGSAGPSAQLSARPGRTPSCTGSRERPLQPRGARPERRRRAARSAEPRCPSEHGHFWGKQSHSFFRALQHELALGRTDRPNTAFRFGILPTFPGKPLLAEAAWRQEGTAGRGPSPRA